MRIIGVILVIAGILMIVFNGINFQTEKKVVDIGPLQIDKKENKHVGWPVYTGAIVSVLGIALVVAGRNK
ncbi:MAG: hypothetical protein P4L41_14170 [Flavipsychrobacter sp.]|nr:hypothetical protein [Flavipsychrobacter sp.]